MACRAGAACGPTPSNPSWNPAVSARSWHGATRRSTTARCESWTPSPPASTSTTTSSPASPRSRRLPHDIASRSTTSASRCSITTGRQLRDYGLSGSAVVMLDGDCSFRNCPPQTRIWWGAYLGTPDELLVSGTVGEVGARDRRTARRGARPARLDHGHLPVATRRLTVAPWQDQPHGELPPARSADRGGAVGGHPRSFPASASSAGTPRWRGSASSSSSR